MVLSSSVETWKEAMLPKGATIRDAIANLNATSLQIVLVTLPENKLYGTLTDGDIRRGLLRGLNLDDLIDMLVNINPLVVPHQLEADAALQLMKANRAQHLPIVDSEYHIIGLFSLKELVLPSERDNTVIIMAGGFGTRLRPHTENCPKPLLSVGGKPLLEHIIERSKQEGFRKFVLAIYYLGHMIEEYCGDGSQWDVQIEYLKEEKPLGTAGAINLYAPKSELPLIITNGDVLTDIQYGDMVDYHVRQGAMGTMAVRQYEWQHPFGVVRTNGVEIVGFEEKPISRSHINAGVYVLEPLALSYLNADERCDMPSLFARLQDDSKKTVVYPMHEPWLDVGRHNDLLQAEEKHAQENSS